MTNERTASSRKMRKARTAATVRASTNFFNNDEHDNSVNLHRVQCVITACGVAPWYARIVASLAFGGV
ncbi:hypothetical protein ACQKJZ_15385 [Sphingomonas sp. NPDC019816]|uniref:hypothetical protein n=1 Tax=Sphingomonas sp. NPDC019816 TaxID=3390679 RepID=UPI003D0425CB